MKKHIDLITNDFLLLGNSNSFNEMDFNFELNVCVCKLE